MWLLVIADSKIFLTRRNFSHEVVHDNDCTVEECLPAGFASTGTNFSSSKNSFVSGKTNAE